MNKPIAQIVESKRRERKRLAALPFSQKIKLLEQLRDRQATIATSPLYRQDLSRVNRALLTRESQTDLDTRKTKGMKNHPARDPQPVTRDQ